MTQPAPDPVSALNALLDRERSALLSGDMTNVAALMAEKEHLVARVAALDPADQAAFDRLRRKLGRNGALLEGALAGLRAASRRLAELNDPAATGGTYDADGRRTEIAILAHRLEKRA